MTDLLHEPFDATALRVNLAVLDWNASRLAREAHVSRNTVGVALKHPERLGLVAKYKITIAIKAALASEGVGGAGRTVEELRRPAVISTPSLAKAKAQ